jgi:hypothetical protein
MIHSFNDLKSFYKDGVALRYIRAEAETATTCDLDDSDEHDPGDELVEFLTDNELLEPPRCPQCSRWRGCPARKGETPGRQRREQGSVDSSLFFPGSFAANPLSGVAAAPAPLCSLLPPPLPARSPWPPGSPTSAEHENKGASATRATGIRTPPSPQKHRKSLSRPVAGVAAVCVLASFPGGQKPSSHRQAQSAGGAVGSLGNARNGFPGSFPLFLSWGEFVEDRCRRCRFLCAGPPCQHTRTGPRSGNRSNGSRETSPKKENHWKSLWRPVAAVAAPLCADWVPPGSAAQAVTVRHLTRGYPRAPGSRRSGGMTNRQNGSSPCIRLAGN